MIDYSGGSIQYLLDHLKLIHQSLFTPGTPRQLVIISAAVLLALIPAQIIKGLALPRLREHWGETSLRFSLTEKALDLIQPLFTALALEVMVLVYCHTDTPCHLLVVSAKLAWAWLLVRLFTAFIVKKAHARLLGLIIYLLLVLELSGFLRPLGKFLDGFGLKTPNFQISLLTMIKGAILAAFLLLLISHLCKFLETYLPKSSRFSPRVQLLLIKTTKLILYTLAVVVALDSVGLDFYLVSVFSGALGLGLGFGLQRVVANLFAGFVILMDRSIRPGDVIEMEGLFGWIETLHGRFVRMVTRDGKSYLIPNEHFINHKVVNWSFGAPEVRVKIPVGISYGSDIHLAMKLMTEAALKRSRVLGYPKPVSRLLGFGDSSINLELRFWMKDPQNGVVNLCSDIQLDIWDRFRENGISFPFPQRDVHLKGSPEVTVVVGQHIAPAEAEPTASGAGGSGASPAPSPPAADPPPRRSDPGSATGE